MIQRQPPREKRSDAKQIMAPRPSNFVHGRAIDSFLPISASPGRSADQSWVGQEEPLRSIGSDLDDVIAYSQQLVGRRSIPVAGSQRSRKLGHNGHARLPSQ